MNAEMKKYQQFKNMIDKLESFIEDQDNKEELINYLKLRTDGIKETWETDQENKTEILQRNSIA